MFGYYCDYDVDQEADCYDFHKEIENKERITKLRRSIDTLDEELFDIGFLNKEAVSDALCDLIFDMNLVSELGYVFPKDLTIERSTQRALQDPIYQAEQSAWYAAASFASGYDEAISISPFFFAGVNALSDTLHSIKQDLKEQRNASAHPGFCSPEDALRELVVQLTSKEPLHADAIKKAIECLAAEYQFELSDYTRDEIEVVRA